MYTEPMLEVILNPNKKEKNLWSLWGLTISTPHLQENTQPWITKWHINDRSILLPVCALMLLWMLFSPAYHNLLSLISQHSWHPVLTHPQCKTFCQSDHRETIFDTRMSHQVKLQFHILYFLDTRWGLSFPMCVTRPAHLILHSFIIHHQTSYWRFYHSGIWCHPTGQ